MNVDPVSCTRKSVDLATACTTSLNAAIVNAKAILKTGEETVCTTCAIPASSLSNCGTNYLLPTYLDNAFQSTASEACPATPFTAAFTGGDPCSCKHAVIGAHYKIFYTADGDNTQVSSVQVVYDTAEV